MKKLLSIILSITMLLSMATVAFADGDNGSMQKAKLTVGINVEFAPFEYYEGEELKGFDIDLMNYIGERIGFDIEFVNMSFDKLIPAVVNGEVNCAISGITITKERESIIDYTRPYLEANVIYNDGEEIFEQYAVVFPDNSKNKARLIEASGDPNFSKYMLVDNAIKELTEDLTIDKLIEKYRLNETTGCTYSITKNLNKEDVSDKDIPRYDTWEEIGLVSPYPSEWANESVIKAQDLEILEKDKNYWYANPITREEFCELIYNLIYNYSQVDMPQVATIPLADTSNEKIRSLYWWKIINGKVTYTQEPVISPDGAYKSYPTLPVIAPKDFLTREEAATIIVRMVNKFFPMAATEMWFEYDDINEVSEWASDSIQTISNLGFMKGIGNNKFAPKERLTTEEAIAILVRVYSRSGVSRNDIVESEMITVTDTVEISKFYIDESLKLITESGKLALDKDFISLYTTNDDMTNKILSLGEMNFNKPKDVLYLYADKDQMVANIKALAGEDAENIDFEKMEKLNKRYNFSTLASLINASYGAENLAALTILTNSRGYIMPKDFKDDFALFIQYEGDYSAIVSFSKYGDGVISANMSFVRNGDKDNIFKRLNEITSAVGKDAVTIARVQ